MAEHPNVGFLRKGYEAFAKGDMATLTDMYSQDVVWHHAGTSPISWKGWIRRASSEAAHMILSEFCIFWECAK